MMTEEQFSIKELDAFCKLDNKVIKLNSRYKNDKRTIGFTIEEDDLS